MTIIEVFARVIFSLVVFSFAVSLTRVSSKDFNKSDDINKVFIQSRCFGYSVMSGKAWRKFYSSKRYRKHIQNWRAYTGLECVLDPYFTLLLCGDIELNPGPANHTKSPKSIIREENSDFFEILLRLEKKIDDGQACVIQNQNQMLDRLSIIEKEIETFKLDIENLKKTHAGLEEKVNAMAETVDINFDRGKDLQFLMDRHEQYSRNSSVRITGVVEQNDEDIESVIIDTLKKEISAEVMQNEIDIVQHVGRRQDNRPRPVLVKFLSHKTKEKVMRAKKNALTVKIKSSIFEH